MKHRYWDSSCFIAWLNEEPDRVDACEGVVQQAKDGDLQIVTSAITLIEVIKPGATLEFDGDKNDIIRRFFQQKFIIVRDVDRTLAEEGRRLIWSYPHLRYKDAIHAATAMLSDGVEVLDTFDTDLLRLDGELGDPGLRIAQPDVPFQTAIAVPDVQP